MVEILSLIAVFLSVLIWFELVKLFPEVPSGPFWLRAILAVVLAASAFAVNMEYAADLQLTGVTKAFWLVCTGWIVGFGTVCACSLLLLMDREVELWISIPETADKGSRSLAECLRFSKSFFLRWLFRRTGLIWSEQKPGKPFLKKEQKEP